jgi:HSP20 family molecular chaperone IbpA
VSVRFDGGELHLEGTTASRESKPAFLSQEFASHDYRRAFQLAPIIDVNKIKAEVRDGVLTVHLPKSAAAKPRQIKIKRG